MKPILAETITIGDEILYGQITDTNTQWMSQELDKIGIKTVRKSSVGDQVERILEILAEAESRADVILITGGLGPTKDDITKHTLARYFGTQLKLHEGALADVTNFFAQLGRELTEINRGQAFLPENAVFLSNKMGTAPGMWFEHNGKVFVSMPGVPHEMQGLMRDVLPRLQAFFQTPIIYHRMVRTVGIGESVLATTIQSWEDALPPHIRLAYLPNLAQVRLRLTATGSDLPTLQREVQEQIDKVLPLIDKYVFGYDETDLEEAIGQLLKERKLTLATAESCTGGYLAHQLTRVAGSSEYFLGGVVAYANAAKTALLGVPETTLAAEGAVSESTVRAMAEGVRQRFGASIGLASTGIAGPGGGTPDKPVGTIWIAYSDTTGTVAKKLQLVKNRDINIKLTAVAVLNLLRRQLTGVSE